MHDTLSDESGKGSLPEIAGYAVLRAIGHGGMSTVYLGQQVSLARQVAIKVMLPEALADEVSRRRFENEARTIARLEHPHIVGIFDVGRTRDGLPYYSMPHLTRGHLGQRIGEHPEGMDQAQVREVLHALLSALGYAHARGTIHRDVKAENVLFDEAERPLLADFGIALRRGYGTRVTTTGMAVGSTAYMAPEQARGEEVDHRADLYSVGVLAWEMLTGKLPYEAGDAVSMAIMHVRDPIPRLPPRLRHWQRFIDHALAKGPLKRFRDAAHMQAALDRVPQRSGTHEMLALPALREKAASVRKMPVWAWLGVLLVVAAGIGVYLRGGQDQDGYFRVQPAPTAVATSADADASVLLPAPPDPAGVVTADPAGALLRAAPKSDAERWVALADRQIRQGRLTTPKDGNARDSLLAAQRSDQAYLGLAPAVGRFVDAMADEVADSLEAGDDERARRLVGDAVSLATVLQQYDAPAVAALNKRMGKALQARVQAAADAFDPAAAKKAVDTARALGLPRTEVAALAARAEDIPRPGERLDRIAGDMVLVRNGDTMLAASRRPVSRDEYARFAAATGRAPARCRASASLLRIVAPRDWKSPGFEQSGDQPVVCVSWDDAAAYARWLGQRDGHAYRLPHAREAGLLPATGGNKRVAEWNTDCSGDCSQRMRSGTSWRGGGGARALEATRGYDDVGIRLVTDLPHAVAKR
ncbi:MAG TPA: bifunctional serine/threonine-protein kinase/formylglycine-generating enzyme family protein [Luteimonas sp.]|nr:bifunctional serine/threonine-protein kinase/formylglycine-generating enzyme family protein [Luteimonas sp.]